MKRDPSLHIKKSGLEAILNSKQVRDLMLDETTPVITLVSAVFKAAQPYQVTDRYKVIQKAKSKTKNKIAKSQAVDLELPEGSTERFNRILTGQRIKQNPNVKVRPILKDSRDYVLLKEVTLIAYRFAKHFELPVLDGFTKFIVTGLEIMRKYGLNRFKTFENRIYEKFECEREIANDDDPSLTDFMHEVWQYWMSLYTEMETIPNLKEDKKEYVHLLYARKHADELEADYNIWVEAQFEGLKWLPTSPIPILSQFYGEKAESRYKKHLANTSVQEGEEDLINQYKEANE